MVLDNDSSSSSSSVLQLKNVMSQRKKSLSRAARCLVGTAIHTRGESAPPLTVVSGTTTSLGYPRTDNLLGRRKTAKPTKSHRDGRHHQVALLVIYPFRVGTSSYVPTY